MIDIYYLTFGYPKHDKVLLKDLLEKKLNISLDRMSGDTFGYRFGDLAETISILDHYEKFDDWWSHPDFKDYPVLINASISQGRNSEKKRKADFLRKKILEIPEIIEIKFTKISEPS